MDWADNKTFFNYSPVRKSVIHKKINYDLLNGKLHMSDMEVVLNPEGIKAGFIPDRIQHYPIMNSKLNILRGEESKRVFDYKVIELILMQSLRSRIMRRMSCCRDLEH